MDFAALLVADNVALAALLGEADLSTPVPTCPEWTVQQLIRHVGRGDRWSAQIVAEKSGDFIDPKTVPGGRPPADRDGQITWLKQGVLGLLDAVEQSGHDTPVWTFLGMRPAAWWVRRRLHETVVHRADAALALGAGFGVEPSVAADAITEYLERVMIRADEEGPAGGDRPREGGRDVFFSHEKRRRRCFVRREGRRPVLGALRGDGEKADAGGRAGEPRGGVCRQRDAPRAVPRVRFTNPRRVEETRCVFASGRPWGMR